MRFGFYNTQPGLLLELGAYNNLKINHPRGFPGYLPQNIFQFGMVNSGNGSLIRFGAVNYNQYDFWEEAGIDFGIVNKGNYVQLGVIGVDTETGFQMNLINLGEGVRQCGLTNIRTGVSSNRRWQCGLVNFSLQNSSDLQWGIVNIASTRVCQIGLVNIGGSDGDTVGLLNIKKSFPYVFPLFFSP
jgi:hypothetical protein